MTGNDAESVADAEALYDQVTDAGIECADPVPFDPTGNINADGFDYAKPSGIICRVDRSEFYLVAYENAEDRVEALDHGEITLALCKLRSGGAEEEGWYSVVGGNWRVASPSAEASIDRLKGAIEGADSEPFGCLFKA